mmetsp:Transcript_17599/g.24442  ORF Transcript_17599/g.24442 Transcript_17599/m.24442 type:complete len:357 (+) Transcript_17599:89-1159(+)
MELFNYHHSPLSVPSVTSSYRPSPPVKKRDSEHLVALEALENSRCFSCCGLHCGSSMFRPFAIAPDVSHNNAARRLICFSHPSHAEQRFETSVLDSNFFQNRLNLPRSVIVLVLQYCRYRLTITRALQALATKFIFLQPNRVRLTHKDVWMEKFSADHLVHLHNGKQCSIYCHKQREFEQYEKSWVDKRFWKDGACSHYDRRADSDGNSSVASQTQWNLTEYWDNLLVKSDKMDTHDELRRKMAETVCHIFKRHTTSRVGFSVCLGSGARFKSAGDNVCDCAKHQLKCSPSRRRKRAGIEEFSGGEARVRRYYAGRAITFFVGLLPSGGLLGMVAKGPPRCDVSITGATNEKCTYI